MTATATATAIATPTAPPAPDLDAILAYAADFADLAPEERPLDGFSAEAAWERCKAYRRRILEISQQVAALHVAPAFSAVEIVDLVYNDLMRWGAGARMTADVGPDVFLMSKGHGCMIQYAILEDRGVLSREDLDAYCRPDGRLGAHPDYGAPGIAAATGSLGHGLGLALGMAHAERRFGGDGRVYLVLSDGECQEGSTWEAAMMAGNLGLENIVAFVDCNDWSGLERMSEAHKAFHPLAEKFAAFGWEAVEAPGHDAAAIRERVLGRAGGKPFVVICDTVKGRGVDFMENAPIWHYRSPNPDEYAWAVDGLTEIRG